MIVPTGGSLRPLPRVLEIAPSWSLRCDQLLDQRGAFCRAFLVTERLSQLRLGLLEACQEVSVAK
jgi:hypothetical protein